MERQAHAGFLGHRDHGLQEVGDVGPHLIERVRAFVGKRRQVLHSLVVEAGVARAGAPGLLVIAFHGAMRVPVVFDDRQPGLARGDDRLLHLLDLFVASGPRVDGIGEPADHQVVEGDASRFVLLDTGAQIVFLPGDGAARRQDVSQCRVA